jgi:serine/threonine-protein kinase
MDPVDELHAALAGRYEVEREIGQGGMGVVYLARDLEHHRQVALKVLRPELASTLADERFSLEVQIASRLHHPSILPVYESGTDSGLAWYTMP